MSEHAVLANAADQAFTRSARESAGPRDWILDVYGSFVRDFGGWIAVADLLTLLRSLNVGDASARSALSRMKGRGEVRSVCRGRIRGYRLTEAADRWFADGTVRIMGEPSAPADDLWVLASFKVPEQDRRLRYQIRTRLKGLGFGHLSGGLMIAPAHIREESQRALEDAGVGDRVDFWESQHMGRSPLVKIVRMAWDIDGIEAAYRQYLSLASELELELESSPVSINGEDAFVRYVVHVNAWRELPFMDPGIPRRYLPENWPAADAWATFGELVTRLRPEALRHFVRITSS